MWNEYPFSNDEVMVLQKSLSLVASTWECLGGLLKGIPTVIADHESVIDPILFSGLCSTHRVSRIYGSPSLFSGIIAQKEKDQTLFRSMKLAFTSAEPISPAQVGDWNTHFDGVPLINLYGSSECSSNALQFRCFGPAASQSRVPIGRPLPNINAYVLDNSQNLLPKGAKGELCISGACLAKGYLDLIEETQTKFVSVDPRLFGHDRLYRTGDLARIRQDNEVELLGRTDFQIQLRGFRIEPGEIENALNSIPDIRESAVRVFESSKGEPRLVAFVACEPSLNENRIKNILRTKLPDYMIPHGVVIVDKLPRTESGKIDRKSLRFEDTFNSDGESLPRMDPRSLESILAHLWRQQLGKAEIGIDDNFFDVGGHSLMAARLFAEIEKISGKTFPVSLLYRAPTIRGLVACLREVGVDRLWSTVVPMRAEGALPPLFCVTPWDGNAIYFRSLPKYLDQGQPIYGLEPLDSTGASRTFTSIHEMIEQYLADLSSFYPVGPLSLCGFSGGGVIAWEIAHRLKAAGREIKGLYFFDTSYPGHKEALENGFSPNELRKKKVKAHLEAILAKPGFRKLSYGLETIILKIRFHLRLKDGESKKAHEEEHRAMEANRKNFEEYSANRYEGKVVLFKARERRFETILDPTMDWSAHTQHGVEVCEIPGGHNTMLLPPHDVMLCKALQSYLNANLGHHLHDHK
jgi:thioesterase domain-containing protein